ncbi:MAG: hypothetical protein JWR85_3728 [Marmoricola sp.]|nr:hypothetical protein [Marmoricola sp.]
MRTDIATLRAVARLAKARAGASTSGQDAGSDQKGESDQERSAASRALMLLASDLEHTAWFLESGGDAMVPN